MDLLADLDAFYLEHRRCGDLESNVTERDPLWVAMACRGRLGYRCRGVLRIDPLLADLGITSLTVVAPTGFEPVFSVRHALS